MGFGIDQDNYCIIFIKLCYVTQAALYRIVEGWHIINDKIQYTHGYPYPNISYIFKYVF